RRRRRKFGKEKARAGGVGGIEGEFYCRMTRK
ncbi:hypothetical protein CSUI_006002, partial [Cystoisospora suis]